MQVSFLFATALLALIAEGLGLPKTIEVVIKVDVCFVGRLRTETQGQRQITIPMELKFSTDNILVAYSGPTDIQGIALPEITTPAHKNLNDKYNICSWTSIKYVSIDIHFDGTNVVPIGEPRILFQDGNSGETPFGKLRRLKEPESSGIALYKKDEQQSNILSIELNTYVYFLTKSTTVVVSSPTTSGEENPRHYLRPGESLGWH